MRKVHVHRQQFVMDTVYLVLISSHSMKILSFSIRDKFVSADDNLQFLYKISVNSTAGDIYLQSYTPLLSNYTP